MTTVTAVEQPIWDNVETKNRIRAGFVYESGQRLVVSFPVDEDNEEYQQFIALSSIEEVEANTQALRDRAAEQREKNIARQAEQTEQKRANALFNTKVEAFEIPVVQNADKEVKAKIRKATTSVEVIAIVTMLMMKDSANDSTSEAAQ